MPMNGRLLRPRQGGDPDALRYIAAVQAADGQPLEAGVRKAINDFVIGCKADGIWSAIKASCILAGARTLAGALTPLVGTAPTNVGPFVAGDYNRETGLVGNGSTKFLNTNRASNADLQNNVHAAVWVSTAEPTANGGLYLGAGGFGINGSINIGSAVTSNLVFFRARTSTIDEISSTLNATGLIGIARSSGTEYSHRINSTNATVVRASQTGLSDNTFIFGRNVGGAVQLPTSGRLAFYSIGESLNLALLNTRVTALINAIGAALP